MTLLHSLLLSLFRIVEGPRQARIVHAQAVGLQSSGLWQTSHTKGSRPRPLSKSVFDGRCHAGVMMATPAGPAPLRSWTQALVTPSDGPIRIEESTHGVVPGPGLQTAER